MNIIQYKTRFFRDLDKIQNAKERAAKRALSRFGAFVRTRARTSMRKRRKASPAGSPPSVHVGYIKKFLFFAYEPNLQNVVIGPALLGRKNESEATVVELQEKGGERQVDEVQLSGGVWVRKSRILADGTMRPTRKRTAIYPERPFMKPAFDAELPKAAPAFKDTFK